MTDIAATAHRAATDRKAHGPQGAHKAGRAGAAGAGAEGAGGLGEFAALMDSVTGASEEKDGLADVIGKAVEGVTEAVDGTMVPGAEVLIDPALQAQMTDVPPPAAEAQPSTVDLLNRIQGKPADAGAARPAKAPVAAPAETVRGEGETAVATGKEKPAGETIVQDGATTSRQAETVATAKPEIATGDARKTAKADKPADPRQVEKAAAQAAESATGKPAAAATTAQGAAVTQATSERPAQEAAPSAKQPMTTTATIAQSDPAQSGAGQFGQGQSSQDGAPSRDGGQSAGRRGGAIRGETRAVGVASAAGAPAGAEGSNALRDIMQSLPPFIQAQLGGTDVRAMTEMAGISAPSTGELLGNQVIDMSVSGQWIDRMAREIADLADGSGHSRFQLSPPNLGRIQVDLWQGDDQTNLRIMTETDEAARRLREGQGALETNARMASLSLGSVTVEKSSESFDQRRDQNGQQNQRQFMDFGGQPQQQAGGQAQGQSEMGQGGLNRGRSQAVIANDQQAEARPVASRGGSSERGVRFA